MKNVIKTVIDPTKIPPLHDALMNAVTRSYKKFGYDYSVTELIDSPRIIQLKRRHPDKLVIPKPISALSATIGVGVHNRFEQLLRPLPKYHLERTMYINIQKRRIKGRFDILYDETALYDIKTASSWKALYGSFDDWYQQLNFYYYMLGVDGIKVKELWALTIFLDWSRTEAAKGGKYPKVKTIAYQFKKESYKNVHKMFKDRIDLHAGAENLHNNELPPCNMDETWGKPDIWAVYKNRKSQSRATKLFKDNAKAVSWAKKMKYDTVDFRPGKRLRCEEYCSCRNVCNQYQEYLKL